MVAEAGFGQLRRLIQFRIPAWSAGTGRLAGRFTKPDGLERDDLRLVSSLNSITDSDPMHSWLEQHETELRSILAQLCTNLALWLSLFRPSADASEGASMLSQLHDTHVALAALEGSAHRLPASAKLCAFANDQITIAAALAEIAIRPAAGLRRISPARWLARKRLRKILSNTGLPGEDPRIADFAAAMRLEIALRPLRGLVGAVAVTLFGKSLDADLSLTGLSQKAADNCDQNQLSACGVRW